VKRAGKIHLESAHRGRSSSSRKQSRKKKGREVRGLITKGFTDGRRISRQSEKKEKGSKGGNDHQDQGDSANGGGRESREWSLQTFENGWVWWVIRGEGGEEQERTLKRLSTQQTSDEEKYI